MVDSQWPQNLVNDAVYFCLMDADYSYSLGRHW